MLLNQDNANPNLAEYKMLGFQPYQIKTNYNDVVASQTLAMNFPKGQYQHRWLKEKLGQHQQSTSMQWD